MQKKVFIPYRKSEKIINNNNNNTRNTQKSSHSRFYRTQSKTDSWGNSTFNYSRTHNVSPSRPSVKIIINLLVAGVSPRQAPLSCPSCRLGNPFTTTFVRLVKACRHPHFYIHGNPFHRRGYIRVYPHFLVFRY